MKNSNDQNKKSSIASEISGIIFITLAILSLVSLLGYHEGDHKSINWFTSKLDQTDLKNYAGIIGVYLSSGLFFLFGIGAFFIPAILGILGINKFKKINPWPKSYIIGFLILSLSMPTFLAALHSSSEISDKTFHLYGLTGSNLSVILKRYFGVADYLFIIFFILLGIILAFRFSLINFFNLLNNFSSIPL
ncbi:DNA translocase FtsK 4TM domain-containing protein [bacterium]|nr:DNA translocase FtsK 4TM domain-containing protein [bacterium]